MTYFGHGPSLENVDPRECAESLGPAPTGLIVDATWTTGDKAEVTWVT